MLDRPQPNRYETQKKALEALYQPVRDVIEAAQLQLKKHTKLRDGDNYILTLHYPEAGRIFKIHEVTVFEEKDTGLIISGAQLDVDGQPVGMLRKVNLPRDPNMVNIVSIEHLFGLDASDMERLAEDLSQSTKLPLRVYDELFDQAKAIGYYNRD